MQTSKKKTDYEAKLLMRAYSEKAKMGIQTESAVNQQGKVHIVPKLVIESASVFLEMTLGIERQYVVKSMQSFCQNMKNGEIVNYGKQLTLLHQMKVFHEDAKPLVRFIMNRYDEAQNLVGNRYNYYTNMDGLYSRGKKGMKLSPAAVDDFLAMYRNQRITVNFSGLHDEREEYIANLREGNPKIDIYVEEKRGEESFLFQTGKIKFLEGAAHLYLIFKEMDQEQDTILWQCDEEYRERMKPFIHAIGKGGSEFTVDKEDMADFCGEVLSEVRENIHLSGDVDLLSAYIPQEMTPIICLDCPQGNVITAVALCRYGNVEIDLYNTQANLRFHEQTGGETLIVRDTKGEFRIKMELSRYFDGYHRAYGALFFDGDNDRVFDFVRNGAPALSELAEIRATDRYKRIGVSPTPKLSVGISLEGDLLKVKFDMEEFSVDELMDTLVQYKARKKYHRLKNGQFIALEEEDFREILQLTEALKLTKGDIEKGKLNIPKYRAMYLNGILKNSHAIHFERDSRFRSLIREMGSVEDSDYEVPSSLQTIMRDYQKMGFRWLKTMKNFGFSAILADDMGLGKTLQVISLLVDHVEHQQSPMCVNQVALVVCPASLVLNWEKEIQKFTPQLRATPVIGTAAERKRILAECAGENPPHVLITSYDLLKRDIMHYENMTFDYHIIDEAQNIKNHSTQNAKAVKAIKSVTRFALTGTPIENRLSELWSIFDFLMPQYFYGYAQFKERYEKAIIKDGDEQQMNLLKKQVEPFVLRRLKSSVLKELPEKSESVVYAKMTGEQRKIYMANLAKVKLEIGKKFEENEGKSKFMILALLTRLRQICCHPALCYEDYPLVNKDGSLGSGKLETCMELVKEGVEGGHKILLFSQFTSMLDLIKKQLTKLAIPHYILTGSTPKEKRMEMVETFNENDISVFLISLKAGGTGLNLIGADVVIHYDPWWNLAAQNQATDRTHRIGQKKSVQVYKLIAEDTIEEKILKLQESKVELAESVIGENSGLIEKMTREELLALI